MKIIKDHRYYIDEYKTLKNFLDGLIELLNNKKIKGIFSQDAITYSSYAKFTDKIYSLIDYNFIVFDDDTVIKSEYNFFSMLYVYYTDIKCLWDEDLEIIKNEAFKLELDYSNSSIIDYEIEIFSDEYIINPRDDATRPEGGDYFKEIIFHLSNNKKLCICAENAEFDGYCDVWIENDNLKGIYNSDSHKVWWKD